MEKQLVISKLTQSQTEKDLFPKENIWASMLSQKIDILNWDTFPYRPEVSFRLAYDEQHFYLRYDVREQYIRAKAVENHGPVWEDSCVEFFISPEGDDTYYNFEFNCIGTKLLAYHEPEKPTVHANSEIMSAIRCISSLGSQAFEEKTGDFSWYLEAVIPFSSLWMHDLTPSVEKKIRANFYKCGDQLTQAHFLSWNPIQTESPSFHQPGFFGKLIFE